MGISRFRGTIVLAVLVGTLGCERRPDQDVRNAFLKFYSPKQSALLAHYDGLKFEGIAQNPSTKYASATRGEISLRHSVIELSSFSITQPVEGESDLIQLFDTASEKSPPDSWLYRNDQYDFSLGEQDRIQFIRTSKQGHVRPYLSLGMMPLAATALGLSFGDLADFDNAEFQFFGESTSERFPNTFELQFTVDSEFNNKPRKGFYRYFFDASTGVCTGAITGESLSKAGLIQHCSTSPYDTDRTKIYLESFSLYEDEPTVAKLRDRTVFICKRLDSPNLDATKLAHHGLPEPNFEAQQPDQFRKNLLYFAVGLSLVFLVGAFVRSRLKTASI